MEHKFLRLFDKQGVWQGNPDRSIKVNGVIHNLDEYAKKQGIQLPDSSSKPTKQNKVKKSKDINIDIEAEHEDLGKSHSSTDTEEHGDGDSEG